MKVYYVSHPFTGNEKENRFDARLMTALLQANEEYQDIYFYNPLDAMRAQDIAELSYAEIMACSLEMMRRCDAVVMTGHWPKSKGCSQEFVAAQSYDIPVFQALNGKLIPLKPMHK